MSKSRLLINEPPLQVLPSLAVVVGLNEAIVIQQLHYLLDNPKIGVERDGFKWVFFTYEEWKDQYFKFWSVSTIQRIFSDLEKEQAVISSQFDKKSYDRRKYYRLNYEWLDTIEDVKLTRSEDVTLTPSLIGNTETTSKNNTAYQRGEQERPDKIAAWLGMAHFEGAKQSERIDAILSYLGVTFTRNTETKEWKEFAKYIISAEKEFGWKVEDFVKWLFSKPDYHPDYWSVKRMTEFYPSAFAEQKQAEPVPIYNPPPESPEYVQAPPRRR